jgi:MoxR-like ATPase
MLARVLQDSADCGKLGDMSTLSAKQSSFISALASVTTVSPVSRQDLLRAANSIGQKFPPAWIVKDAARHAGRGLFHVPELTGGTKSAAAVRDTAKSVRPAAPVAAAPAAAAPIKVAAAPMNLIASAAVMGMTGGDRSTLVPAICPEYVAWGHFTDVEKILRTNMFAPVFVTGLSGNGKTTMIEQVCAKLGRECFRVNIVAETDEDDLFGGFRLVNGNMEWHDGPVVLAMKRGAVLLLDEIDLGSDKLMCLQSVLEGKGVYLKKINQWVVPAAGFTVFATANTKGKGDENGRFAGTRVLNEAMLDRFDYTYEQEYAPKATEKKILLRAMKKFGAVDDSFADNLTKWADMIRKAFMEGACDEMISTRRLINIVKANIVFADKSKAVQMALARFDSSTQESFFNSYTKIDAEVANAQDAAAAAAPAAPAQGATPACPF